MKTLIISALLTFTLTSIPVVAEDFRRTFEPTQIKEFTETMAQIAVRVDPIQAQTHCDKLEMNCSGLLDMWALNDLEPAMVAVFANPNTLEKIIYLTPRYSFKPIIISDQPFEIMRNKEITDETPVGFNTQFVTEIFGFIRDGAMFSIQLYQAEGVTGIGEGGPCTYPADEEKQIPIDKVCIVAFGVGLDFSSLSFKFGEAPE